MKQKSALKRRPAKPAGRTAGCKGPVIPGSPANRSFPVIAMAASSGGLKAFIGEQGGTVIPQDRPMSENFSMPETSIKTGDVDFILPLDEIAPTLIALVWTGQERKSGRLAAKPTPAPARTKGVTTHYAAEGKTVMLKQRN